MRNHAAPIIMKLNYTSNFFWIEHLTLIFHTTFFTTILGMRSSKSYSDSGKTQAELSKKASENPKEMTESEWHDLLDGQTFYVTREKGTERPWTSCLNDEKRNGTFSCTCCSHPLFTSASVIST